MRESAVFVWADRALFIGDRSETAMHAHHAIELCVGLDAAGIDMSGPTTSLRGAPAVLVRSASAHKLSIPGPKVAVFYIDPHTPLGGGLTGWLGDRAIAAIDSDTVEESRQAIRGLFEEGAGLSEARQAIDPLLGSLCPTPPPVRVDWRIKRARTFLDGRLEAPPRQAEVAAHVGLSSSRLGHLFTAQVGLPMRRYLLWMRLRAALTHAMDGTPMTEAALLAGFSDAAHFTRTCQRMFGLPPTAFAPVDAVFVHVDDEATSSFK